MNKHTAGPWMIDNTGFQAGRVAAGEKTVAQMFGQEDESEGAANARLVAAAPEMLEVLRHVSALLIHGENPGENGEGYADHLDAVRAVIAKAEGGK